MRFRRSRVWQWTLIAFFCAASIPLAVSATDTDAERAQFRAALAAANQPPQDAWKKIALGLDPGYPLYPYLELTALRARLPKIQRAEVERFLSRWPDSLAASDLRNAYLRELARRGDWATFRVLWKKSSDRDLQCDELQARLAAGAKLDYATDLESLWNGANALPTACDPVISAARASAALSDAHVWERLYRAAAMGHVGAVTEAAALLGGADRLAADRMVAVLRDPAAAWINAETWEDEPRARDALSYGLARFARRNSAAAESAWADLQSRFKWDAAQRNRVLNALALYRATSYSPDALARLKALPPDAADDATREWSVRLELAGGDYAATLAALKAMPAPQNDDPRWRYLRARMLERLGHSAEAAPIFQVLAREANFYGFLAADHDNHSYSICPAKLAGDPKTEAALATQIDLRRAFEFREIGMLPEARREWAFAMTRLDGDQRRLAADFAYRRGWYDRAVFAFSADPDTQHLYEQRFPLGMRKQVERESRDAGIDPAWTYAIIRAESAWTIDAHSGANAYGLMQLLPAVAKQLAQVEKLPYSRPTDLFTPMLNIQLGTRFLGRMANKYDGSPWLASAAYNAGEAPVGRWLEARATLDPDFFIETIPYKETREYVSRVLAFSVIYDWRMNGSVIALSRRLPRAGQAYQAPNAQTARKAVTCVSENAAAVADNSGPG